MVDLRHRTYLEAGVDFEQVDGAAEQVDGQVQRRPARQPRLRREHHVALDAAAWSKRNRSAI